MNIPLAFGQYTGRSPAANAMEMVNMMVESDNEGGAAPYFLTATPGCKAYVDLGVTGEGRGGFAYPGKCLCVVGATLFAIDTSDGSVTQAGTLHTTTGAVQFCENPTQVMLIDSTDGYVYTKSTGDFNVIMDGDFPLPLSCTWKDGYGAVVQANTGKIYISNINQFFLWDALGFATAEFEPDNLLGVFASPDSLLAFGEKTLQAYYNSGNPTYPFDPRTGSNLQVGCGATNSIAGGHNLVFWLDNTGGVRMLAGSAPQIISTSQIDYQIAQLSTFSDAKGYVYTQEGHIFYTLSFPTDKITLVYDVTTGQWHKRTSYKTGSQWRPAWVAQDGVLVLAGDYSNGKVYQLDSATYTDNSKATRWFCTTQNINSDRNKLVHDRLELHVETGVGGQGEDPKLWMQYSDDDGRTWSHEKWRSMGKVGEYSKRIYWDVLGQSRSRVYRFGGSSTGKRNIISAHLEVRDLGN